MKRKNLEIIELVIGIVILFVGVFVTYIDDCVSEKWLIGLILVAIGTCLVCLNSNRLDNEHD